MHDEYRRTADALGHVAGMQFNFTQPMAMRLDEVVSGVKADVAVKVFGADAAELQISAHFSAQERRGCHTPVL